MDAVQPSPQSEVMFIFFTTAQACRQINKKKHQFPNAMDSGPCPLSKSCSSKRWIINKCDLKRCDLLAFISQDSGRGLLVWSWTRLAHICYDYGWYKCVVFDRIGCVRKSNAEICIILRTDLVNKAYLRQSGWLLLNDCCLLLTQNILNKFIHKNTHKNIQFLLKQSWWKPWKQWQKI